MTEKMIAALRARKRLGVLGNPLFFVDSYSMFVVNNPTGRTISYLLTQHVIPWTLHEYFVRVEAGEFSLQNARKIKMET